MNARDGTRFGRYPWDLRTLIAVAPCGAPLRFLNLNWVLGRTGTRFDQSPDRSRAAARRVADLQFCLESPAGALSWKREYGLDQVEYEEGHVALSIGERLQVRGAWPRYDISYAQPEAELKLDVCFEAWPHPMRWVRLPGLYCHQTVFGTASIRSTRAGETQQLELPALLDHGWGRSLLPLRAPMRSFRYEVLHLPEGGQLLALGVRGPLGARVVARAVHRISRDARARLGRVRWEILESSVTPNHAGAPRHQPSRWRATLDFGDTTFTYEAEADSPPRAVLGDGFLQSFSWRRVDARGPGTAGRGYAEQLGRMRSDASLS